MSYLIFVAAKLFMFSFAVHVMLCLKLHDKTVLSKKIEVHGLQNFSKSDVRFVFSHGMLMGAIRASPPSL